MSRCGYCGADGGHRPYSRKRDMPSASAIAGLLDDGKSRSFAWSASLTAAVTAVHKSNEWVGLGYSGCTHEKAGLCPACRYIRSQFDRDWNAKADIGTHIHHLALDYALGEDVEVDEVSAPFIDALDLFYVGHEPTWVELEQTVLYDTPISHGYRGQFDAVCEINCPIHTELINGQRQRCRWLIDFKTGGYWPLEQTLQLAAYRYAQWITDWTSGKEQRARAMPPVAHAGVLLLGAHGGRLVELPADGDAHAVFLRLVDAWRYMKRMKKWERDNPVPIST